VLRVVDLGRVSDPDRQTMESVAASQDYAEAFLRDKHAGPMRVERLGEQASGLLATRPSIETARELIEAGEVDVVVSEDCGRVYRNPGTGWRSSRTPWTPASGSSAWPTGWTPRTNAGRRCTTWR
jgi:hypothetical protein